MTAAGPVLLLGWAAAEWRQLQPLLDRGALPHLAALIERGVMGYLYAPPPLVPALLWTDLATGTRADRHGVSAPVRVLTAAACAGRAAPAAPPPLTPATAADLAVPTLWQRVQTHGLRAAVVGWPVTHPAAQDGAGPLVVSDAFAEARGPDFDHWPLRAGAVSDPALALPLAELRVHPSEVTAQQVRPFVPRLAEVDQETDERLALLVASLARAASVHAAGTWIAEHRAPDLLAVHFALLERLTAAFLRYQAPRLPQVSERDHGIYCDVLEGGYRFLDLLLGRYLELMPAGTRVLLVSAHGTLTGALRPRPRRQTFGEPTEPNWRDLGVLAAAGPGLNVDTLVFGARVHDIAPIVLHLLGVPAAAELEGRVPTGLLAEPAATAPPHPRPAPRPLPATAAAAPDDADWRRGRLVELTALGELPALPRDPEAAAEAVQALALANLAEVKLGRRQWGEALELLKSLRALVPQDFATGIGVARCQLALANLDACRATLADLALDDPSLAAPTGGGLRRAEFAQLQAELCRGAGDLAGARAQLARAEAAAIGARHLLERIGRGWLAADDPVAAERTFRAALRLDPEHARALGGLGLALARQARHADACEPLMRALGVLQHQPDLHFQLGLSLAAIGQNAAALEALDNARALAPDLPGLSAARERLHRALAQAAVAASRERGGG